MTVRERVLTSRLIQKTNINKHYARQIGLSCAVVLGGIDNSNKILGQGKGEEKTADSRICG